MAAKRRNEQVFDHITTYGRRLTPTNFPDGFNVGTVIAHRPDGGIEDLYDIIVHRTPKTIVTEPVRVTRSTKDRNGMVCVPRPVPVKLVHGSDKHQTTRMRDGKFILDGAEARIWDNPDGVEMLEDNAI